MWISSAGLSSLLVNMAGPQTGTKHSLRDWRQGTQHRGDLLSLWGWQARELSLSGETLCKAAIFSHLTRSVNSNQSWFVKTQTMIVLMSFISFMSIFCVWGWVKEVVRFSGGEEQYCFCSYTGVRKWTMFTYISQLKLLGLTHFHLLRYTMVCRHRTDSASWLSC